MKDFGLALGGGGVKGLAHIALLKTLDQIGAKPTVIAGTSIGAIIGALYASGLSGLEIEERVREHLFSRKGGIKGAYRRRKHLLKWLKVFAFEKARGGLIAADGLFEHLFCELVEKNFSELDIPFVAVAADFHSGEEVVLNSGSVLTAVQASMAVPGVFAPVERNGRMLIDGGVVNNVPCKHVVLKSTAALTNTSVSSHASALDRASNLSNKSSIIIASDVISLSDVERPKMAQVLSGAFSIMLRTSTEQHFALNPPDFIFRPGTSDIEPFDFHKISAILDCGEQAMSAEVSQKLENLLV